jgi:signal transduction histidine kinase
MRKHRWVWIVLFVCVIGVLLSLATGWNIVLVRDHLNLVELARKIPQEPITPPGPWLSVVLGTVGFLTVCLGLVLLFMKALREMKLNQAQSEFLASVSHELKTPLATLELCGSLIRLGATEEERARLWEAFDSELRRLKDQVTNLLEAARWQAHEDRLSPQELPLEQWLGESLPRWRSILGPDAHLERQGAALLGKARVDPKALNLIADNLVDNAKKFARGIPRLRIQTEEIAGRWRVSFVDEGWGFRPGDSDKIFQRFKRGKALAPYSVPGTGLGLYLAATASRASRLKLTGTSHGYEQGATFTLEGPSR